MNNVVIDLAKAAISAALDQPENFDLEQALRENPQLQENGAAFVTLNTTPDSQLRGCIGTLKAYRPLYEDIFLNAQHAALHDSRFSPLRAEELKHIKVEVSILSELKVLPYRDVEDLKTKIRPFKDGVLLKHGTHQATYLPQVWEQLPQFDDFFSYLCLKANLDKNCLCEHPEISTYQVEKYQEE